MVSGINLINKTPMPVQTKVQQADIPAAISVSKVLENEETKDTRTFIEKIRDKFVEKRMRKLENTPVEQLSENEKAELEANKNNPSRLFSLLK